MSMRPFKINKTIIIAVVIFGIAALIYYQYLISLI